MLTASPITRQTVGKTFSVAISALGAGAALQLIIIGWAFATRPANPLPSAMAMNSGTVNPAATIATAASVSQPDFRRDPFTDEPPRQMSTTPAPEGPQRPTPVPNKPAVEPTNRYEELISLAKQLFQRGDTGAAIIKLREGIAMDPKNPIAIAELAAVYEKMQAPDRAAEQWKRILDMGEAAGIYYTLAKTKLEVAVRDATQQGATENPADTAVAVEGIAAGSTLGLLPVRIEDQADDGSAKRFTLHVPIKARPKTKMEVRDLVIHVLFYDIVDGQNVVQTSANVNSRWMAPPADWTESDVEELAVEYQLPKPDARASKRENRKFFGYIVRVYYKQQLQAATAEPARLSQQYPPPPTLPKDDK
jgi:tetratricopeptide (TPR) repeat protein